MVFFPGGKKLENCLSALATALNCYRSISVSAAALRLGLWVGKGGTLLRWVGESSAHPWILTIRNLTPLMLGLCRAAVFMQGGGKG